MSFFLHHQLVPDLFRELLLLSQLLKDQFPVLFLFRSCCCYRCYGCRYFLSFQMQSCKISGCRYRKCIRQYLPCLLLFLLLRLYKGRSVFLLRSVRRSLDLHQTDPKEDPKFDIVQIIFSLIIRKDHIESTVCCDKFFVFF